MPCSSEIYHPINKYTVTEIMRAPAHIRNPDISTMSRFHLGSVTPRGGSIQIVSTLHLSSPGIEPQAGALTSCILTTDAKASDLDFRRPYWVSLMLKLNSATAGIRTADPWVNQNYIIQFPIPSTGISCDHNLLYIVLCFVVSVFHCPINLDTIPSQCPIQCIPQVTTAVKYS